MTFALNENLLNTCVPNSLLINRLWSQQERATKKVRQLLRLTGIEISDESFKDSRFSSTNLRNGHSIFFSTQNPDRNSMKNMILRGILIGSSLGVLLALTGFSDSIPRAFFVGAIGGALAGYTLWRKRK